MLTSRDSLPFVRYFLLLRRQDLLTPQRGRQTSVASPKASFRRTYAAAVTESAHIGLRSRRLREPPLRGQLESSIGPRLSLAHNLHTQTKLDSRSEPLPSDQATRN